MERPVGLDLGKLEVYSFRRRPYPLFTKEVALEILSAAESGLGEVEVSLDLWRSRETVALSKSGVEVRGAAVPLDALREILDDDRSVYALVSGALEKLEVRADHFYKLVKSGPGHAPTLEIDGIHMHRVKGIHPEEDARLKVMKASRKLKDSVVLDICTGLGYTASSALELGASFILTVEKDVNVLKLAELNPWSWVLESEKVVVINDDASSLIFELPSNFFEVAIHDPPRLALAGELYSREFYGEVFRVLRRGGTLVHYVGRPGERFRGIRLYRGVAERLRRLGFKVSVDKRLGVVVGEKLGGSP
ncbi:MAG: SAM-dependent methyltransferase [Nitrososphaerota archaeon]|nr:SAM-dependent methyltransferase [Nitrososphaerota archaeon]